MNGLNRQVEKQRLFLVVFARIVLLNESYCFSSKHMGRIVPSFIRHLTASFSAVRLSIFGPGSSYCMLKLIFAPQIESKKGYQSHGKLEFVPTGNVRCAICPRHGSDIHLVSKRRPVFLLPGAIQGGHCKLKYARNTCHSKELLASD
jgi:hypothetical protein